MNNFLLHLGVIRILVFLGKKTGSEDSGDMSEVTQLIKGRAGVHI